MMENQHNEICEWHKDLAVKMFYSNYFYATIPCDVHILKHTPSFVKLIKKFYEK